MLLQYPPCQNPGYSSGCVVWLTDPLPLTNRSTGCITSPARGGGKGSGTTPKPNRNVGCFIFDRNVRLNQKYKKQL